MYRENQYLLIAIKDQESHLMKECAFAVSNPAGPSLLSAVKTLEVPIWNVPMCVSGGRILVWVDHFWLPKLVRPD